MKNIYLVGFMGTGKTTVGKILAEKLNKEFVEMDDVIEERESRSIVDIFAQNGEPYFRNLEKQLLKELAKESDLIVSCGGGLICDEENSKILKKTGIIFNLVATPLTIYERTKKYTHRPLLNVDDPLEKIKELLEKRRPYYEKVHFNIDTEKFSAEEVAEEIVKIIRSHPEIVS
ncbi:MAG TPA: shikimate kinase [Candidatus Omnitrophica bacterium]|nr:shikimate kinase [Candidatus Omnitrophota bacterium]